MIAPSSVCLSRPVVGHRPAAACPRGRPEPRCRDRRSRASSATAAKARARARYSSRLAGQHANYVKRQLADYKSGKRKNDTMQAMASDLTAEEMPAGMYFESKATRTRRGRLTPELGWQVGRFCLQPRQPSPASLPVPTATAPPATAPTACRAWAASTRSTWRTSPPSASARAHQRQRGDATPSPPSSASWS